MATIKHIEIAGVDGRALQSFYSRLFGWEMSKRDVAGVDYFDADVPGALTAGIRHEPDGPPEIVVYVEVDALDESVKVAEQLGASVRIPPMESGDIRFALILDPEGNPIGLIEGNPENPASER